MSYRTSLLRWLTLSLLQLLQFTLSVYAEDWPQHRGPRYDGVSHDPTPLAEEWPAAGPPLVWRRSLGQGFSGLIVVDGVVYTQFQDRVAQYVVALNAATGDELWRQQVDWPWQAVGGYPGPYATPTFAAGRLFYATPAGTFGCLAADTGRKLWSLDIRRKFRGEGTEFGFAASPTVVGKTVLLPIGAKGASVVAFSTDDGSIIWQAGDDIASYASIYPAQLGERDVLVAYLRNHVVLHDPQTGNVLWREKISASYDEHSTWPLYAEGRLTIAGPFQAGARQYEFTVADGEIRGKEVWFRREFSNDVCSSLLFERLIFGFDLQQAQASAHRTSRGNYKCLDMLSGKVLWETKTIAHGSSCIADRKLFVLEDTGTLVMLRATGDKLTELARARVLSEEIGWTPPVIMQGRVFVRNPTEIACFDLRCEIPQASRSQVPQFAPSVARSQRWLTPAMLVPYEPEFPHDEPTPELVGSWFIAILGSVFLPAAVVATAVGFVGRYRGWKQIAVKCQVSFLITAFLLGALGTTLLGHWQQEYLLTWPASLYVAFRGTLALALWANITQTPRARWSSRAAVVTLLGLAWGYYQLCFFTGYVMAWAFLGGFGPAAIFILGAEYVRRPLLRWSLEIAAFTVYFWTSGLLPNLKSQTLG